MQKNNSQLNKDSQFSIFNFQLNKYSPLKIAIAGTGYVGLSNGLLLAQRSNAVVALASPDPLVSLGLLVSWSSLDLKSI